MDGNKIAEDAKRRISTPGINFAGSWKREVYGLADMRALTWDST